DAPSAPEPGQDRVSVVRQRAATDDARARLLAALDGTDHGVVRSFESVPYVALELSRPALERLEATGVVTGVTEDKPLVPYLHDTAPLIEADQAWAAGGTGAGQVVAVLDTGVDATHPFLAGKVVHEACFV